MAKKNILVGQSGGPTSVINSSLAGVITAGLECPEKVDKVIGMVHGIEGFRAGRTCNLSGLTAYDLDVLKTTPSAYLGSCRYKLPENLNDPVFPELFRKFEEMNIGYFFYCGGNDSMDTVSKLSRYGASIGSDIRCMGVPKTIDNDLIITDHCPGYPSAAKFVATTVRQVTMDAKVYGKKFLTIVEIMGRDAGWLTASSVMARKYDGDNPVLIYMPEVNFSMEKFWADVDKAFEIRNDVLVCISEGIHDAQGTLMCEYASDNVAVDSFGHKALGNTASFLAEQAKIHYPGLKVRGIELSLMQRCAATNASGRDIQEAFTAGHMAGQLALAGETGKMIAFIREPGEEYKISYLPVDVNQVCNQVKEFPREWIVGDENDISMEYVKYAQPLIQGEAPVKYEHGLPKFLYRS